MNIVERVARAICASKAMNPDFIRSDFDGKTWSLWVEYKTQAQAAIDSSMVKELEDALETCIDALECGCGFSNAEESARTALARYRGDE